VRFVVLLLLLAGCRPMATAPTAAIPKPDTQRLAATQWLSYLRSTDPPLPALVSLEARHEASRWAIVARFERAPGDSDWYTVVELVSDSTDCLAYLGTAYRLTNDGEQTGSGPTEVTLDGPILTVSFSDTLGPAQPTAVGLTLIRPSTHTLDYYAVSLAPGVVALPKRHGSISLVSTGGVSVVPTTE
jgi:hypothetical protein